MTDQPIDHAEQLGQDDLTSYLLERTARAPAAPLAVEDSKAWQKSLTVQGAGVAALAGVVLSAGPPLLAACGQNAADATELCKNLAQILVSLGALMTVIGRLRLGGLH